MTNKFKPDPVLNENINTEFVKDEFKDQYVPLPQKVYVKAGEMMSDKGYEEAYLGDHLRFKMKRDQKRFWAGDNISDYLHEGDIEKLIDEATEAFELVLDRLLIDRENDPNSQGTARRLAKVANECTGFVYAASLMGVTGTRSLVSANAKQLVERVRSVSNTPVAVGLGVSNKEQAKEVAVFADGVIVGSAFIKVVQEFGAGRTGLKKVKQLAESLSEGVRSARKI